ncbi:MAG: rhomboid family intramembrane serine protease [Gemmatimonadetes bacterium]|nr:rhomboid family intramembrane serine protease [Gemmatimonadota bacterium]
MAYRGFGMSFGYGLTPWVTRLLIANGVAFVLTLPLDPRFVVEWLAFTPAHILTRPWGLLTYMFIHGGFWHLFVNMLGLFFFGAPLEDRWGSREFLKYYFICGLGGAILSFLFVSYPIIGASAAVYGIMLAFALNWPDAPIYVWGIFPVKAKWLVAFLFAVTFLSSFSNSPSDVANFAHLGGFVAGWLYLKMDWRFSQRLAALRRGARTRRLAIVPREDVSPEPLSRGRDGGLPSEEDALLDAVDRVLDKISASGLASLTPEERRLLDEVSRRRRTN